MMGMVIFLGYCTPSPSPSPIVHVREQPEFLPLVDRIVVLGLGACFGKGGYLASAVVWVVRLGLHLLKILVLVRFRLHWARAQLVRLSYKLRLMVGILEKDDHPCV